MIRVLFLSYRKANHKTKCYTLKCSTNVLFFFFFFSFFARSVFFFYFFFCQSCHWLSLNWLGICEMMIVLMTMTMMVNDVGSVQWPHNIYIIFFSFSCCCCFISPFQISLEFLLIFHTRRKIFVDFMVFFSVFLFVSHSHKHTHIQFA